MYTLLSKNILKNYRVSSKTIKNRSIIINDLNSLLLLQVGSKVLVFFEHSISLNYLKDLQAALNLDIILVVNNEKDLALTSRIFNSKMIQWDFIDGDLVNSIFLNDEKQMEALSTGNPPKVKTMSLEGLYEEAKKIAFASTGTETTKLVAAGFLNLIDSINNREDEFNSLKGELEETKKYNLSLKATLDAMAVDMDDFVKTYKSIQAQMASRNVLDVIRDNNSIQIPTSLTSLVIKNYGCPNLIKFVKALKDALTTSFDKYTKVLYIIEPDSASIQEINRNDFFLLTTETKASDLLKHDMLLCVGNTKEPVDFLTSTSAMDILVIVDCRRNTTELITGQSLTMYAAMDIDAAINLNLDANRTITSSEKSIYTIKESEFSSKKRHILRNNELVLRVANSLLISG